MRFVRWKFHWPGANPYGDCTSEGTLKAGLISAAAVVVCQHREQEGRHLQVPLMDPSSTCKELSDGVAEVYPVVHIINVVHEMLLRSLLRT